MCKNSRSCSKTHSKTGIVESILLIPCQTLTISFRA